MGSFVATFLVCWPDALSGPVCEVIEADAGWRSHGECRAFLPPVRQSLIWQLEAEGLGAATVSEGECGPMGAPV